jgi:isoquinoline 1-oxidoreductase subunit beta
LGRLRAVLELAAEKSGRGKPLPKGRGGGMAAYASFGSYFAEVVEVTVKGSEFKIGRIVAAVDCGQIVNRSRCVRRRRARLFLG